ncbi:hypothetical protein GCM10028819_42850 [Spirosoma humi]
MANSDDQFQPLNNQPEDGHQPQKPIPQADSQSSLDQQSEAKYRTLFNAIDEGFSLLEVILDQTGKVVDYWHRDHNPAFTRMTGLKEVIGKRMSELVPNLEPEWHRTLEKVYRTGEPIRMEYPVQQLGQWYSAYLSRLGSKGSPFIACIYDDITERKRLEERQAYLLKLSDAMRPLTDAIAIQETAARVLGEHMGVDRAYYGSYDWERGVAVVERDFFRGEVPSIVGEHPLASYDGSLQSHRDGVLVVDDVEAERSLPPSDVVAYRALSVRSVLNVVLVKQGVWVASMTVLKAVPHHWTNQEISLLKATAEQTWDAVARAKAEEALRQADQRKDEFLAMLGHELRNPLASLSNTLLVLQLTKGADQSLSYPQAVEQMSREVAHMSRMMDDLLDVGRIRYGLIHLRKKPLDLVTIVRQTVDTAKPFYDQQHRQLSLSLPAYALPILGDETRLAQVVMNLLTNGLKYTHPGGHVWVSLQGLKDDAQNQQALLRVKDDGIAPDQQGAIFDIFVQGATTLDRPQGGLGLGLAVVKQLVGLHEGSLEVHSPGLGEGSEFVVRLPLQPESVPLGSTREPILHTPKAKGRILVIEDNQTLGDMTARLVALNGYEARVSYSGADGLALAEQWRPDVILLDLGLPHMDGFEVSRRLREQSWGHSLPIVALTGYSPQSFQARTEQAGFAAYLIKPLNLLQLREVLKNLINPPFAQPPD